ncbi:septation ring formation regulator EzrA [Virgibacillus halodenitrificans]|uniref:Septation ring formation regulator EzrA n=1 Tax=Virgibacillus halodenitrificans TaxID=1482 RepID=A0ABR7VPR4_VIRHA|nr:septation ring formation regulator EzrA [Virgibacillus halodenitrificans]MBD1223904.1 septation ring formation regulator EzrA [Virgibacillus halodenitrificans]MCJ0931773.1 septation ring formation regulator EzrA [Virgibacillus halodenitrificans]MEC2159828.1 septation ring formation regulator EzrA [Virgibacillus halodenitrificans]MYL59144.1 septation ring formation regulator EzrA [Virgibacillus halodenitrificans]WHX27770.1 septation ring formation regulator EzrA [Virgibacillus halodenitrific
MAYIIGIILVIIALIIIGLIMRKRIYDHVDRYEAWKMDIMGRNVAAHLSKIKSLNLSGETQEKFEAWKERWEFIITKELPDIEEHLFDAEESADRYRFSKAKKILHNVEEILQSIEKEIEKLLAEVDELLQSEESSRQEVEEILPHIKACRKKLSQNRYQYGKAEAYFDKEIDVLEKKLNNYYSLVEQGNYLEAKQIVDEIKLSLDQLEQQLEVFPRIYKLCKYELPSQLDNLYSGIKGMKEDGYRVEHLAFEKEIRTYQEQLLLMVKKLEAGDLQNTESLIEDVEVRIKEMYQLLEKEALAKNYLDTQIPSYEESLGDINNAFLDTKLEVEKLKHAYYFEDHDMERYLMLENTIAKLKTELEELLLELENEDTSHSKLREQVEQGFEQLKELNEKHDAFRKRVHNLRKDELEAKEKLIEIRNKLADTQRKLKKSNVPGVPQFIWDMIRKASDKNTRVMKVLEKQPLEMSNVQEALAEANDAVEHVIEQTNVMLDQAYLTEQVIQYANRYRSQYPLLAAKLAEAERLFRTYDYELALEHAAKAIEEIEPGALKKIEEFQQTAN